MCLWLAMSIGHSTKISVAGLEIAEITAIRVIFRGETNVLFRNNGDGTFRNVSVATGVALPAGKSLGVAIDDIDGDGLVPDVYVANDSVAEFLLHNREGKKFEEIGLQSMAGVTMDGNTFAGMGVDFADYDNDGWPDIFVTALSLEGFALFRNQRDSQLFRRVCRNPG